MSPTTDEEALIAAIRAAPLDDAPRLVYADWLQERGDEDRADYLRTVVRLLHAPDDRPTVERCVRLSAGIDAEWRRAVGDRFEVVLEGAIAIRYLAFMFQMMMKLATHQVADVWHKGEPVRLTGPATREDAEAFVIRYDLSMLLHAPEGDDPVRLVVRLTDDEPPE